MSGHKERTPDAATSKRSKIGTIPPFLLYHKRPEKSIGE